METFKINDSITISTKNYKDLKFDNNKIDVKEVILTNNNINQLIILFNDYKNRITQLIKTNNNILEEFYEDIDLKIVFNENITVINKYLEYLHLVWNKLKILKIKDLDGLEKEINELELSYKDLNKNIENKLKENKEEGIYI